jgi:tetratricopeptide (TPR) repeat protein
MEAYVELAAGDPASAETVARDAYEQLGTIGEQGFRSSLGCYLARALLALERWSEAEQIALEAGQMGAEDDFFTQSESRQIRALLDSRAGRHNEAERLAREAVAIAEPTDSWPVRGQAKLALAHVLDAAGRRDEARTAMKEAQTLFARKANQAAADRAKQQRPELM